MSFHVYYTVEFEFLKLSCFINFTKYIFFNIKRWEISSETMFCNL